MFACLFVLASTPFKTCVSADHMHLSDLTLSPDPPVHGEHVSLKITSTPDIAITAGTVTVAATVFGIPVPGGPTYDLCTEVGFHCPLAPAKPVAASVDYRVSPHVPPGIDATISLQIKDGDGAEIGCASFDVKVGGAEGGGLPGGGKHAEARRQLGAREQQPPQQQAQQAQAQPALQSKRVTFTDVTIKDYQPGPYNPGLWPPPPTREQRDQQRVHWAQEPEDDEKEP